MSRPDRVDDIKFLPSAGAKVSIEKAVWLEWTRVEIYYYLLGKGFDINYERAESPSSTSKDITAGLQSWRWEENEHPRIFLGQVNGEIEAEDYEWTLNAMASDWQECDPNAPKVKSAWDND